MLACIIAWGRGVPGRLAEPARAELAPFADLVRNPLYQTARDKEGSTRFRFEAAGRGEREVRDVREVDI